jgi:hypothetical protein
MRNSNSPAFAALGSPENGLRTSAAEAGEAKSTENTGTHIHATSKDVF